VGVKGKGSLEIINAVTAWLLRSLVASGSRWKKTTPKITPQAKGRILSSLVLEERRQKGRMTPQQEAAVSTAAAVSLGQFDSS
jgi:hypothetical protein